MSWTDNGAIKVIKQLRDDFNITTAVETGTFKGINAELYAHLFDYVYTCDINEGYLMIAKERLKKYPNVKVHLLDSADMLATIAQNGIFVFIYLDAHFYRPDKRWVVIDELEALQGYNQCVVCIHDFDNGELGHLCYDGEHLDWNVVKGYIQRVNPRFCFYTNTRESCEIFNKDTVYQLPITIDEGVLDSLEYANSSDEKRYRGILYATPEPLDLRKYNLRRFYEPIYRR